MPYGVFSLIVPTVSTTNDSDEVTDNVMSVLTRDVNNEILPTTECVTPESNSAASFSSAGTIPTLATLTFWCQDFNLSSFALARTGQFGDQCPTSPQ
ncbi:hypothetical protein O181_014730 [Austropuccinia psidii MF-1]|uniref:Uncharacterized protein n=1 Tax=Austropuccinia psidii MF-1 TaxID=1389203 RepID=A0A9Q3GQ76_9BASI|nr:hypothetical protein [Austropuccinia psidii MF-1]